MLWDFQKLLFEITTEFCRSWGSYKMSKLPNLPDLQCNCNAGSIHLRSWKIPFFVVDHLSVFGSFAGDLERTRCCNPVAGNGQAWMPLLPKETERDIISHFLWLFAPTRALFIFSSWCTTRDPSAPQPLFQFSIRLMLSRQSLWIATKSSMQLWATPEKLRNLFH